MSIIGVYLAAGSSRRMGCRKQALELAPGVHLAGSGLAALRDSGVNGLIVVVHPEDPLVWLDAGFLAGQADGPGLVVAVCLEADQGMALSLQCGIRAASNEGADAVLIALADQPFVTSAWLTQLIGVWRSSPRLDYVISEAGGETMPPAVLSATMFEVASGLKGDQGAKRLLDSSRFHGVRLASADPWLALDIDTPEEWREAKRMWTLWPDRAILGCKRY
ncbi:molybdenum cofactor cytidylyltransferase [Paenibacillus rhizosphaerae]|uniref:Molybdenum cofactor cytidylyltransferase n=1 Tax=Paenibacillus rhizosphaerae TaxID=297318 RepID=A0A839TTF2_9BACL|nr:nucleotidyltransferase family protein [Paenibacillus rhizosphaerae]MBB3127987.1 molybdenum cofactor cytidylyltransferase [Paenibacillus rhizosphaerae]